jgi:hypothetical protein
MNLPIEEQVIVLMNMILLLECRRVEDVVGLVAIGVKKTNRIRESVGNKLPNKYKVIKIIDQSDTGLYEKVWSYNGVENLLELCGE